MDDHRPPPAGARRGVEALSLLRAGRPRGRRGAQGGRRAGAVVRGLVVAWVAVVGVWALTRGSADPPARVVSVVDGDTIEIDWEGGRERVRILGVDTPETVHPDRAVECFGPEAAAFTRATLAGRGVALRFDVERRDRYGRLLAYVTVGGRDVSEELLRRGLARFMVVPPNGAGSRPLLELELEARRAGRGLWGACSPIAGDGDRRGR